MAGIARRSSRGWISSAVARVALLGALVAVAAWALLGPEPTRPQSADAAGCAPARPHAFGTFVEAIETPHGPRSYRVHVPWSYDGTRAVPLLLSFHGLTATAADQEYFSGFSGLSDSSAGGFIAVYPQGSTSSAMPVSHWNAWQLAAPEVGDVAFVDQLLDRLQSLLCIDRSRVYANGASNGGMMAVRLACSLSERIAAVSTVVGLYYPPMSLTPFPNPNEACPDSRPVPLIAFHGSGDQVVPFQGGDGLWNFRLPVDDPAGGESALLTWAQHNGCTGGRSEHQLGPEASLVSYEGCNSDATVQLYVVHGGPHTWPQLAPDPVTGERAVDATAQSWLFLAQHTLDAESVQAGSGRFESIVIQHDLPEPVDFAFAPDGRVFVASRYGDVRIIQDGALLPDPFVTLPANTSVQRGLMGLALDPDFASNGFVYLYYTHEHNPSDPTGPKTGRLIRVTAEGNTALLGSDVILLGTAADDAASPSCSNLPAGSDCLPADGCCHVGGALRFAPDGTLFVSTGDAAVEGDAMLHAQDLDSLAGKILRVLPTDGSAPSDNPFYTGDSQANRSKVWAYGLREPFRMAIQPGTGLPVVGDVGSVYEEELNVAFAGANFGWPCYEGTAQHVPQNGLQGCQDLYRSAVPIAHPSYTYSHNETAAIIAGVFNDGAAYPSDFAGAFFFGDFNRGEIRTAHIDPTGQLDPTTLQVLVDDSNVHPFLRKGPVDFEVGPEGNIYYLSLPLWGGQGELRALRWAGSILSPTAEVVAIPPSGPVPLTVRFDASASHDPDGQALAYSWDFGDGGSSSSAAPAHTYAVEGRHAVTLTVTNKDGASDSQTLEVQAGVPPRVTITGPAYGDSSGTGAVISYSGFAIDGKSGPLPSGDLIWSVLLHHCELGDSWICHWHSYQHSSGKDTGALIMPNQGDDVMYLEFQLSATNSRGVTGTASAFIGPDGDRDGLLDFQEALFVGTDRFDPDTNHNGVLDGDDDFDGDRCTNVTELGPDPMGGGMRDPQDPWDYFNPSGDGRNRTDDILAVINHYFVSDSAPGYSTAFDRGGFHGPNAWDLRPPDGQVRIDDILAAVRSYLQDCP